MTFEELDLDPKLLTAIEEQHYHKPTPIQAEAIPEMLLSKDVLAGAATGTGKTAAFVLPALQFLLDDPRPSRKPRVLILAPTRELAFQIHKVVKQLGTHCPFESNVVTGGFASDKQLEILQSNMDILVATPGRLLNIMSKEFIDLSDIELLIIDEADRMLDMGQGPDVLALIEAIPGDFQAACFSATLAGSGITKFAEEVLDSPEVIQVNAPNEKSEQIQQLVYLANDKAHKQALLKAILEDETCQSAIVFCNKKDRAIELADWLQNEQISSTVLHGDFIQAKRLEKTQKFKQGKVKVLVATDVAARGLDISNVTHVINYDIPYRGDIYIHRIGRTGRAQQVGIAINLVERHDITNLQRIEYHLQQSLPVSKIKGLEPSFKLKDALKKPKKKKKKAAKKKKK
ncbi:ATP-dependent RNA helicase SrmB [Hydrogenovibrio crunogenus]|uniref:ATP-dependent RNA helicase SrmB n=1 Tax=Hydrogenovibrio crunogenus TaxID=39765 RepID=A0A4P7P3G7_9GAMM|nr:DEAD/DEAH box helicase [Hydrogenovibrio crunogenus]QBZ83922.1 ATP-dependent RNA helicase SrmB [Hydrogenovibrio crunogenus]RUM93179.1 MAG: DEAD/DEAH box helicase [Thiomicrospira sp.]